MSQFKPLDLLIIGGGIGGVIGLKYAQDAGLRAELLERKNGVGGIWRDLPSWQDIQIRKEDWTLGDIPISGEDQRSIRENIEAWVERFNLSDLIHLNSPVESARYMNNEWQVTVGNQLYRSRFLLSATGGHNLPIIPKVERSVNSIEEFHSSALMSPSEVNGKDVVVVGGGASAYDLLDLCFENQARKVVWIYRSTKWMLPSRKKKYLGSDIRFLGRQQMLGVSIDRQNKFVRQNLKSRYHKAGLDSITPHQEFDFKRHQLIPGRRGMIQNFEHIERHQGEISRISEDAVHLSNGEKIDAQMVLWGTGYALDLSYFDCSELSDLTRLDALAKRCGSLFRSVDAPNLFFLAPNVLETNTATPWLYAHACKSIVSHVLGNKVFDTEVISGHVNHYDQVKLLARKDRKNYLAGLWYLKYLYLALFHPKQLPMPIP